MSETDPGLEMIRLLAAVARDVDEGKLVDDERGLAFDLLGSLKDEYLAEHPLPE
jgi:hypothetical protein